MHLNLADVGILCIIQACFVVGQTLYYRRLRQRTTADVIKTALSGVSTLLSTREADIKIETDLAVISAGVKRLEELTAAAHALRNGEPGALEAAVAVVQNSPSGDHANGAATAALQEMVIAAIDEKETAATAQG